MAGRRKQDWSTRFTRKTFRDELSAVMEDATGAFWAVIARNFPEAQGGDLPPETTVSQYHRNLTAVLTWLTLNASEQVAKEARVFLEEIRGL